MYNDWKGKNKYEQQIMVVSFNIPGIIKIATNNLEGLRGSH